MVSSDIGSHRTSMPGSPGKPRIEEKLESTQNRLLYLIKKVNQLSKAQRNTGTGAVTKDRLMQCAERLRKAGLGIEHTDGRGFVKLRALDQKGLDNLKRLNTMFPMSLVESFLDNVID
jgi:hypothetical protein